MRLRAGQARVCVGPRSAVFAPLDDIGLIVVDEEHESSYKHEGDPRYDARTVARERAARHGAVLVFGSATPRPESVLAMPRLRLTQRVDHRPLPGVEVLDMRDHHQPLHPETRMALADLRRGGGKAILLLNRRGWSNFLSCRACGRVWLCPNCDVALVLHRHGHFIACHHCGHRERMPDRCGACASVSVARHGAGTERIEHELREALGSDPAHPFPIFRLDADSSSLPERARTLQRFQAAPAGVLVGTQMVAKGHDFADVSLGVVLDADQTLRTSGPRSGRSRSSPSSPAGPGEAPSPAASWCRRWPPRRGRSASPPATTPTASSPTSSSAGARSPIHPTPRSSASCARPRTRRWPARPPPPSTASWPPSTRPCSGRRRCFGCAAAPAASS
jgi:primosomal protein N'